MANIYTQSENTYQPLFEEVYLPVEDNELFDLTMPDDRLEKMLIDSLDKNVEYWNQDPWKLKDTDVDNVRYLLGDQKQSNEFVRDDIKVDNRLFAATRAILSYATGQLATPEITPSRSDDEYVRMARNIQSALYQHAADEKVDQKTRAAVMNLIVRKRGFMKLRYDPNAGMYGDIVTEVCNPEDIIIDRHAKFMENPNIIYHRIRCTVDELCAKFPQKESEIRVAFGIKQGRYTQLSKFVTYFEAWFTYMDAKKLPREGVAWFLPEQHIILDKMPNPNWVYTGDDKKDKVSNVTSHAPKPFVWFNYLNMGHSFIDETSLFDQAKPQQEALNRREKQYNQNVDFQNGRWIASKKALSEEDATKFINKGAKTIALVNTDDVNKALKVETPLAMSRDVYQSILDFRAEIDVMMGTPAIFRGEQPAQSDTLGRDIMVRNQAGALQDDLVRCIALGMEEYYKTLLQMMRVYYTDDYWFQVKGGDGKFDFIMLNGDNIDSNVKIGVQVDSTLPLDKEKVRATAMELWKAGQSIDYLTFMEDLGLPNPDIRAERYLRSKIDPIGYMKSVEQQIDNNDAEVDIMLLTAGKQPQERDNYDEEYLAYFNHYLTTNKFAQLAQDVKQRLVSYLMVVQHLAIDSANLQTAMLDEAGITEAPITPPAPQRNIRIMGRLNPQDSEQIAGIQPPPTSPQVPTQ